MSVGTPTLHAALLGLLSLVAFAVPGTSTARTLNAANNGVDSAQCGTQAQPCRSISRTIGNAADGDTIIVGEGRYGDLNDDDAFGGEGEELAPASCFCIIHLDKRLTIRSESGALQTLLDGGDTERSVVEITASFVQFGAQRGGFTLTGSARAGLDINAPEGVIVVGNFATNRTGGRFGDGFRVTRGSHHQLIGNVAADGGRGFALFGQDLLLTRNVSLRNSGPGFVTDGSRILLRHDASYGNSIGFQLAGPDHVLNMNSAIGNTVIGIAVTGAQPERAATGGIQIHNNNIYGNGTHFQGSIQNCGIQNSAGTEVDARLNFWGRPTGPGSEPADELCFRPGPIRFVPAADTKFAVLETPLLMNLPAN